MTIAVGSRVKFLGLNGDPDEDFDFSIDTIRAGHTGAVHSITSDSPWPYKVNWDGVDYPGGMSHGTNELELIMPESDSKAIADRLRFIANHVIDQDAGSAAVVRAYAEELDPQPITVELSARGRDILLALVEGGNIHSMTNRAKHGYTKDVGQVTFDEREALLEALRES